MNNMGSNIVGKLADNLGDKQVGPFMVFSTFLAIGYGIYAFTAGNYSAEVNGVHITPGKQATENDELIDADDNGDAAIVDSL